MASLASLKVGQAGIISGYTREDATTQRLMQLGLIQGATIGVVRRAPAGDPMEVRVLGYSLSLRHSEAETILVEANPA